MQALNHIKRQIAIAVAATIASCVSFAHAVEIINLRSGYDEVNSVSLANGAADTNITQISGTAGAPLSAVAFTSTNFANARSGGTAFVTAPHGAWLPPASFPDPQARWINWTGNLTPRSVLYAMPFNVTTTGITGASLIFTWCVDDSLGDQGNPNPAGVYFGIGNGAGVATSPIINGGAYNAATSVTRNITGQIQTGSNYLYVYQDDIGATASGTIFSATIRVLPEPSTVGTFAVIGTVLLLRRHRRTTH